MEIMGNSAGGGRFGKFLEGNFRPVTSTEGVNRDAGCAVKRGFGAPDKRSSFGGKF